MDPEKPPKCYPLHGRSVVVPGVAIVKTADLEWCTPPFVEIDVLASSAVSKPTLTSDDLSYSEPVQTEMFERAAAILQAASLNGSRVLILGAWGCGGFRNPTVCVAELFRRLLFDD